MEIYSHPVLPEFDQAMTLAEHLPIIDCVDIAAQCGVVYNVALASSLTRYDILEAVWSEGDFTRLRELLNDALADK